MTTTYAFPPTLQLHLHSHGSLFKRRRDRIWANMQNCTCGGHGMRGGRIGDGEILGWRFPNFFPSSIVSALITHLSKAVSSIKDGPDDLIFFLSLFDEKPSQSCRRRGKRSLTLPKLHGDTLSKIFHLIPFWKLLQSDCYTRGGKYWLALKRLKMLECDGKSKLQMADC